MEVTLEFENGQKTTLKNVVKFHPHEEAKQMNFSEAVKALKMGDKVKRFGWGKNNYIALGGCGSDVIPIVLFYEAKTTNWCPILLDLQATDWWIVT